MLHPEDVGEFVTVVCDTADLPSLEAIYQQVQDMSKNPSEARNKAKEN